MFSVGLSSSSEWLAAKNDLDFKEPLRVTSGAMDGCINKQINLCCASENTLVFSRFSEHKQEKTCNFLNYQMLRGRKISHKESRVRFLERLRC